MSRLTFSKASLHKQGALLKRYRQYLPSLDLKRQQLMVEKNKASAQMQLTEHEIGQIERFISEHVPMLADTRIALDDLVIVRNVRTRLQNIVGVELPCLEGIHFEETEYSFFCKPHWVDLFVVKMKKMLELRIRLHIEQQRFERLSIALKKVTQRVNLFDKVLIPRTQKNIRKISIYLSDSDRASVVRAKITKQKRGRDGHC